MTLKILASAVIAAATALLLRTVCYFPYRCNQDIKVATPMSMAALTSADPFSSARLARRSAAIVEPCMRQVPYMIDPYMIAALDERIVGNREEAMRLYRAALEYDRRPELYLQLGLTALDMGRQAEAQQALELAVAFDPSMITDIPDPDVRQKLTERAR